MQTGWAVVNTVSGLRCGCLTLLTAAVDECRSGPAHRLPNLRHMSLLPIAVDSTAMASRDGERDCSLSCRSRPE